MLKATKGQVGGWIHCATTLANWHVVEALGLARCWFRIRKAYQVNNGLGTHPNDGVADLQHVVIDNQRPCIRADTICIAVMKARVCSIELKLAPGTIDFSAKLREHSQGSHRSFRRHRLWQQAS